MISVDEALDRILSSLVALPAETLPLRMASGRILAEAPTARLNQPWADVSAMDGYAVRGDDLSRLPTTLMVTDEAAAGGRSAAALSKGEAARIFTGAPVPEGADTVVIQENCERVGDQVTIREATVGRHIRRQGMDFSIGDAPLAVGQKLSSRHIGLMAAMNHPWARVHRRPRIAILATGNEIVLPGEPIGENQIVSSNALLLTSLIEAERAEVIDLGIALDDEDHLRALGTAAKGADLLVTTGGASVGDHDLVRKVLGVDGLDIDFWKIAMRPGKPLMYGKAGETPLLGLPGNPVSSFVCAMLFLRPALRRLSGLGLEKCIDGGREADLTKPLPANDKRQDYMRGQLHNDGTVTPFEVQDSAHLTALARANALIIRPPFAAPLAAGEKVDVLPI